MTPSDHDVATQDDKFPTIPGNETPTTPSDGFVAVQGAHALAVQGGDTPASPGNESHQLQALML